MKFNKNKLYILLSTVYVAVTAVINIYGYFRLPDEIATQIGADNQVNHMPKVVFLPVSFFIVLILALFGFRNEPNQKLKYLIINSIIFIVNLIVILLQL